MAVVTKDRVGAVLVAAAAVVGLVLVFSTHDAARSGNEPGSTPGTSQVERAPARDDTPAPGGAPSEGPAPAPVPGQPPPAGDGN